MVFIGLNASLLEVCIFLVFVAGSIRQLLSFDGLVHADRDACEIGIGDEVSGVYQVACCISAAAVGASLRAYKYDWYWQVLERERQCRRAVMHRVRAVRYYYPVNAFLDLLLDFVCHEVVVRESHVLGPHVAYQP